MNALPFEFGCKLRILPTALHGAEASLVSERNICTLRSTFVRAGWSGRLSLANPGAVLSLLDGPLGPDPAFHVVWCRFRMMRRFLAYNSRVLDIARIYRLLGELNKSCMKVMLECVQ